MQLLEEEGEGVVLAPSLYWYIQKNLPTKSLHKAKRYALSLINDAPEGFSELLLFKNGEFYDIYAYNPALLKKATESFDHPMPIFALQQFIDQLPARIDEGHIAVAIEGVAVILSDEAQKLPAFSPNVSAIRPLLENHENQSASSVLISAALILLIMAILFDGILHLQRYQTAKQWLENQRSERTLYEIKALIRKYEKIEDNYKMKRKDMERLLRRTGLHSIVCDEKGCRNE